MDTLLNTLGIGIGDRDSTLRQSIGYAVSLLALAAIAFAVQATAGADVSSFVFAAGALEAIHAGTAGESWEDYVPRWCAILAALILAALAMGVL